MVDDGAARIEPIADAASGADVAATKGDEDPIARALVLKSNLSMQAVVDGAIAVVIQGVARLCCRKPRRARAPRSPAAQPRADLAGA